jgi:predicted PurR-regulated permease PerM
VSAEPETPLFGTVERRLFRATAVLFAIVALVGLTAGIVWMLGIALSFFYSLIMPLCVAGILALVLNPVVDYLERWARLPRFIATTIVMLLFMAVIAGFIIIVAPALIRELVLFAEMVPQLFIRWQEYMINRFPSFTRMVMESAQDGEIKQIMPGLQNTRKAITSFAGLMAGLSFVPLLLFFALLSGGRLHSQVTSVLSVFRARTQKNVMYFIDVFVAQVTGFFQGQLVIAVIMGIMYALGFTLIGLKGGILIGLLLGLLNIVPFLGTLIGLLIVLPLAYTQTHGGFPLLFLSLLVFSVVQLVESWLLTPKIMANRSGLHPALVVISVFFWGTAFGGITGMVLAVPLTAFFVAVWSQAKASLTRSMTSIDDAHRIEIPTGTAHNSRLKDSREETPAATETPSTE